MANHSVTMLFLVVILSSFSGVNGLPDVEFNGPVLPIHLPILIEGDEDFTKENGVVGGSGSEEDPFVISGWMISAPHHTAITIRNTTSHLLIADNDLVFAYFHYPYNSAGIRIMNASNISMEGNTLIAAQHGIQALWSSNIKIDSNNIQGTQVVGSGNVIVALLGIGAFESANVEIVDNEVSGYGWGIDVTSGTRHASVEGNKVSNVSHQGIGVSESREVDIIDNSISGQGIRIDGINVRVAHNTISDVFWDFDVSESKGITIAYNTVQKVFSHSHYGACEDCIAFGNFFEGMAEGMAVFQMTFTKNVFRNNDVVIGDGTAEHIVFHNNDLDDSNEVFAIANGVTLDLTGNWWGDDEGPDPDKFETVNGGEVIVEPWLTNPPV